VCWLSAIVDRNVGKDSQVSLGAWRYSAQLPSLAGPTSGEDAGVFGFVEGPLPFLDDTSGCIRVGGASPAVQVISRNVGARLVRKRPFARRPDDRVGIAISGAIISPTARQVFGLRHAETTIEATYQVNISESVVLQPDLQYIVHPSSQAGLPNALAIGFRVVLTGGFPQKAKATEASDPTVPPNTPQPAEPQPAPPASS
jgi:porin